MNTLLVQFLLFVHILSGTLALLTGIIALIAKKGKQRHQQSGKMFWISMNIVGISALILSVNSWNAFLFWISLFCLFMNYFGKRAIRNKLMKPSATDWLIVCVGWFTTLGMFLTFHPVLLIFGSLCGLQSLQQTRIFVLFVQTKNLPHNTWLFRHISLMSGTFIGTSTAFLVVNFQHFEQAWIVWILPSLVGTFIITFQLRKLRRISEYRKIISIVVMLSATFSIEKIAAQVYVDGGNTRHRFAQMNFGVDVRVFSPAKTELFQVAANGELSTQSSQPQTETRFILGGTHFWGHADFFVAFPIARFNKTGFRPGIETGGRYFPWRIEQAKVRPFVGASFLVTGYQQQDGTALVRYRYPLSLGLVYNRGKHLFELCAGYSFHFREKYYYAATEATAIDLHHLWFSAGYKYSLETTLSAEENWKNGKTQQWTEVLAQQKKLNGLTIAGGPSASIFTKKSGYNQQVHPYLDEHKAGKVFGDLGLGYYWHKPDLQINLAWRSNRSSLSAFGINEQLSRKSIAFEVLKFLTDYHGFCAFAGPSLSYEWLNVRIEDDGLKLTDDSFSGLKPGIIFGWDIRPDRIQRFILRTNLRYFPNLSVKTASGKRFSMDQLEFNFIQLVIYPGRFFK